VKDHYRTLGLHPKASAGEVKAAYRALARRHHPDAAPDNPFAAETFRAVQEAYAVLSHPAQRRRYDEERWLSGLFPKDARGAVTPDTLLRDARRLTQHLRAIPAHGINHEALQRLLLFLLEDEHAAVLRASGDAERTALFSAEILESAQRLKPHYFEDVAVRLALLVPGDEVMLRRIFLAGKTARTHARWERFTPLLLALGVLLLLLGMLLAGPRR